MNTQETRQTISADVINDLAREWDRLKAKDRRKQVGELASTYGVNLGSVYRCVKQFREGRSREISIRADRGKPRVLSSDDMLLYVEIIMGLKGYDPTKPKKLIGNPNKSMSTAQALEIAEKLGVVPEGKLTVRTVNRWARNYRTTVKDMCTPTPAVKLVSAHPNQVHVIDFSVCEQYYLRDSDGKIITRPWTYKNKPNESKEKIWAFALVDHYSNVKFIKYFLSAGESTEILFQGLVEAWNKKDDTQFPFHGAPRIVYADKGSALMSHKIQNLLKALNVESVEHMPGNPRAKGMVETAFRHIQQDFETELRHCPASSIEELNDRMYNWLLAHNWKAKTGEKIPRFSRWQEITNEQLLELPHREILRKVSASHTVRTVDVYCSIRLNGEIHGVPEGLVGRKVRVWHNIDGGISVQDIETGEMFDTNEQRTAAFGTFNAHKKSEAQRRQEESLRMVGELRKDITPNILRRDIPNLHSLPKTGTPIEVDSDLSYEEPESYSSIYHAKTAMAEELRMNLSDLPMGMLEEIEKALTETLDKNKVHNIARFVAQFLDEMKDAV